MMNGTIDWAGLPVICDLLGVDDPAELVDDLLTLRDHFVRAANG